MEKITIEFEKPVDAGRAHAMTEIIADVLVDFKFKCNMSSYSRINRTEHLSIYDEDIW